MPLPNLSAKYCRRKDAMKELENKIDYIKVIGN